MREWIDHYEKNIEKNNSKISYCDDLSAALSVDSPSLQQAIILLGELLHSDQRYRTMSSPQSAQDFFRIDEINQQMLKKLLPEIEQYDRSSNMINEHESMEKAIWLIVDHADQDVGFQQSFLQKYGSRLESMNHAFLEDRISMNTKKPQKYGSQGLVTDSYYLHNIEGINTDQKIKMTNKKGYQYVILTNDDIDCLNKKRAEMGFNISLEEQKNVMTQGLGGDTEIKMLANIQ